MSKEFFSFKVLWLTLDITLIFLYQASPLPTPGYIMHFQSRTSIISFKKTYYILKDIIFLFLNSVPQRQQLSLL